MSIYVIGDLHLSFGTNKPMDIFGFNWENHAEKIKMNWIEKVKEDDLVVLPGDFSWAMDLEDTYEDFKFLSLLPGKKLLLKGNHDYWWTTLNKMRNYLKDNKFENIDFIQNNYYEYENIVITGVRGWTIDNKEENEKYQKREKLRLETNLEKIKKEKGGETEIIVCLHYPPFTKDLIPRSDIDLSKVMENYNIHTCVYGHLHGEACNQAFEGEKNGINYILASSDYLEFDLKKIK
ncbi:MAG: metallophosphoesterase [Clostridia bacterium]|nr:metallophosphoesterase [Clostridia bacterium]